MRKKCLYIILLLLMGVGCFSNGPKEGLPKDPETGLPLFESGRKLIIEPNVVGCFDLIERECLIINGRLSYDRVRGFEYEPRIWKKVLVNVYEEPPGRQDVGKYYYVLTSIVDELSEATNPTSEELCLFYEGRWNNKAQPRCMIKDTELYSTYCEHVSC